MTFNATPPTQTYSYDQENRLTGAAGYAYTYDGDGNRVLKSNTSWSEVVVTGGVNELKFTGKRRDTESQLDYFGARYYSNAFGRFLTPDWAAKPGVPTPRHQTS